MERHSLSVNRHEDIVRGVTKYKILTDDGLKVVFFNYKNYTSKTPVKGPNGHFYKFSNTFRTNFKIS